LSLRVKLFIVGVHLLASSRPLGQYHSPVFVHVRGWT